MVAGDRKMKATGLVTNEVQNGATLARSYDFLGRPTGYVIDGRDALRRVRREVSYTYDALGRLATMTGTTYPPAEGCPQRGGVASCPLVEEVGSSISTGGTPVVPVYQRARRPLSQYINGRDARCPSVSTDETPVVPVYQRARRPLSQSWGHE